MVESAGRASKRLRPHDAPVENTVSASGSPPEQQPPAPAAQGASKADEKQYRAWLRKGCRHRTRCFDCQEGPDNKFLLCQTCILSFHEKCLPQPISQFFHTGLFFCRICLGRNWHVDPPPLLSPPSSPRSQRARVALPDHKPGETPGGSVPYTRGTYLLPESFNTSTRPSSQSRSISSQHANDQPLAPAHHLGGTGRDAAFPEDSTSTVGNEAGADSARSLRSRFSTLSPEVDNAVSVVLRELEYLRESKEKIARLETKVMKLEQDVRISENARRLAEQTTSVQDHLQLQTAKAQNEQLRAQVESGIRLLAEETSKSEKYKAEMDKSQTELGELRAKLRSLLGT